MNELDSSPLDALVRVAKQTRLIDDYRKTEWVVVLEIDDHELVMNHANAQIFLQGMVRGALRAQLFPEETLRGLMQDMSASWTDDDPILIR